MRETGDHTEMMIKEDLLLEIAHSVTFHIMIVNVGTILRVSTTITPKLPLERNDPEMGPGTIEIKEKFLDRVGPALTGRQKFFRPIGDRYRPGQKSPVLIACTILFEPVPPGHNFNIYTVFFDRSVDPL